MTSKKTTELFETNRVYTEAEIRSICPRTLITENGECLGYDFSQYADTCLVVVERVSSGHKPPYLAVLCWFVPEDEDWKVRGGMVTVLGNLPDGDSPTTD